jgi:hypothetical protein
MIFLYLVDAIKYAPQKPLKKNASLCTQIPQTHLRLPTIRRIRQPLNNILPLGHTHNRHTRNLPNPPLQIPIIRRDQINSMLLHPIHNTVVRIRALVIALQALPALVARNAQRNAVLGTQFLELGHDAGCDDGRGFGVKQVHEGFVELEFAAHGVRQEVGVDKDGVGGPEGGVGLEEEGGGDLRAVGCVLVWWTNRLLYVGMGRTSRAWLAALASSFRLLSRRPFGSFSCVSCQREWCWEWWAHSCVQAGIALACGC